MPIRREYIFRISTAYQRNADDDAEIISDSADGLEWGKGYTNFKKNIRNFLKRAQRGRCAFCRCYINLGTSYSNLEHLVSKNEYPQFKFLPINIVYCCWKCNKGKRILNTLVNPITDKTQQTYPAHSDEFLIINPYHDNYEDHIEFYDDILIVIRNNSTKGQKTIEFYSLTRPELAEQRAWEFNLTQQDINHILMQRLTINANDPEIITQVNNIIEQLPNWTI